MNVSLILALATQPVMIYLPHLYCTRVLVMLDTFQAIRRASVCSHFQ